MHTLLAALVLLVPVPEEKDIEVDAWLHKDHVPSTLKPGDRVDVGMGWVYPRSWKDGPRIDLPVAEDVEVVALDNNTHPLDSRLTVRVRLRADPITAAKIEIARFAPQAIVEQDATGQFITRTRPRLLYLDRILAPKP
jgi:hypothetical protein